MNPRLIIPACCLLTSTVQLSARTSLSAFDCGSAVGGVVVDLPWTESVSVLAVLLLSNLIAKFAVDRIARVT